MVGQLFLQLIWTTLPGRPLRRWRWRWRIVKNNLDHFLGPASCQEELSSATSFANYVNPSPEWVGTTSETRTRLSVKRSVPYSEQLLEDFLWHRMQSFPKDRDSVWEFTTNVTNQKFWKPLSERGISPSTLRKGRCLAARPNPAEIIEKRLKLLLTNILTTKLF